MILFGFRHTAREVEFKRIFSTASGFSAFLSVCYMNQTGSNANIDIIVIIRQLLVCNIPNFARLFVMTSASICACNPTKLRA